VKKITSTKKAKTHKKEWSYIETWWMKERERERNIERERERERKRERERAWNTMMRKSVLTYGGAPGMDAFSREWARSLDDDVLSSIPALRACTCMSPTTHACHQRHMHVTNDPQSHDKWKTSTSNTSFQAIDWFKHRKKRETGARRRGRKKRMTKLVSFKTNRGNDGVKVRWRRGGMTSKKSTLIERLVNALGHTDVCKQHKLLEDDMEKGKDLKDQKTVIRRKSKNIETLYFHSAIDT
jgi:hypothetical protein